MQAAEAKRCVPALFLSPGPRARPLPACPLVLARGPFPTLGPTPALTGAVAGGLGDAQAAEPAVGILSDLGGAVLLNVGAVVSVTHHHLQAGCRLTAQGAEVRAPLPWGAAPACPIKFRLAALHRPLAGASVPCTAGCSGPGPRFPLGEAGKRHDASALLFGTTQSCSKTSWLACGAPFITRSMVPVLLSLTNAMVYLSVGLNGTNLVRVFSCHRVSLQGRGPKGTELVECVQYAVRRGGAA